MYPAATRPLRFLLRFFAGLALTLSGASPAKAHSTTFAVYSKYEATASGRTVAVVFALDKRAVLQLLEAEVTHAPVDARALPQHLAWFSDFVFQRFSIRNDDAPCTHPDRLATFFFHEQTGRVVAITRFDCPADLDQLTIHSTVTHDMPTAHELVGDLHYGGALVRHFFSGDDTETHVALGKLAAHAGTTAPAKRHSRFAYVAVPDKERRYSELAESTLGLSFATEAAQNVHPGQTLLHFIGQGILHIFTGYDHVLFILTLMLAVYSWRRLAVIVTSFTAAHSITLIAATLGLVTVPSRVIEPLIALSVLLVAVDALVRPKANARAWVTFGFGLVHGFGLSNVLRELGLSGRELAPALLGFNIGVELGQLAIVAPLFPLIVWLRRRPPAYTRARAILCGSVAVLAICWIVLRVGAAISG